MCIRDSLEEVCGALGGASWEGVIMPRRDGLARLDALRVAVRCRVPCLATRAGVLQGRIQEVHVKYAGRHRCVA
eukprot:9114234-Alexandrium_andersonii.AAC.1